MKILFITAGMGVGGRERQLFELMRGLDGKLDFRLLVLSETVSWDISAMGVEYICLEKLKRNNPQTLLKALRYIHSYKPDIIHYWDYPSKIPALLAKITMPCKLLDGSIRFVGEAPANKLVSWLKKTSFSIADHIVANSKEGLRYKRLLGKSNASVIYNGLDLDRFGNQGDAAVNIPGIIEGKYHVVMVAGFQPAKDYLTLIKAANELCPRYPELRFVLVGDGALRKVCESAVAPESKNRVCFAGKRSDVEQILLRCDIGVLLSSDTEGLSNSIMEYMAAGLPVIATRKGGTPELVADGESGFLIDNFQVGQLVKHLEFLMLNPAVSNSMGDKGKSIIREHFLFDSMITGYIGLYRQLMATTTKRNVTG